MGTMIMGERPSFANRFGRPLVGTASGRRIAALCGIGEAQLFDVFRLHNLISTAGTRWPAKRARREAEALMEQNFFNGLPPVQHVYDDEYDDGEYFNEPGYNRVIMAWRVNVRKRRRGVSRSQRPRSDRPARCS